MFKIPDFQAEPEKEVRDLSKAFEDSIIDLTKEVDRPPNALTIGIDDRSYKGVHYPLRCCTFGNISMIVGEEKSRKSFLKSLLEACAIGGKSNNFTNGIDIRGHNLEDKFIISIDAEQDTYDAWLNGIRVPKMVGGMYDGYKMLKWREKSKDERIELLDWLYMESPYKDKLGIVVMDGFVDFVKDFNDLKECDEFASKLMKYSSITHSHIMGVLHLNPNSEKARGHLGTIIGQKCETVIIIKNMGDYSVVKRKVGRGKTFEPFTIRVDDEWLPYISDDEINNEQQNIKLS